MALSPCPECQKDVSDKALACPSCGMPLKAGASRDATERVRLLVAGGVLALLAAGATLAATGGEGRRGGAKKTGYALVEQLRAEQDTRGGTHDEHVRQRFFRLYNEHPGDAMYTYLWARCLDDPQKRIDLAEQGIREDPRFSWNYNLAARALAQLDRVKEAYDYAQKGVALDPGSMQLADKRRLLGVIVDRKLLDQPKLATTTYVAYDKDALDKGAARYEGLFRSFIQSPDRADLQAIEKSRLPDTKDVGAAVRGLVVCKNPFSDACVRVYAARDDISDAGKTKVVWAKPTVEKGALKPDALVSVAGAVVKNARGDSILLADVITVEAAATAPTPRPASAP